jgi:uncharacterized membrane protein
MEIPVNTFWLTVMNVALGLAVLLGVFVVALAVVEEIWAQHRMVALSSRPLHPLSARSRHLRL